MRLKTAFVTSQIGLVISFLIVLIGGIVIYTNLTNYHLLTNQLSNYKQVITDTLNLQSEFALDRDDNMPLWAEEQFNDFSQIHFTIKKKFLNDPVPELALNQIQESVKQFEANLSRQLLIQKKLGFTEDEGLRGNFRKAVHELQSISNQLQDTKLELLILELRRREKDYVLRWDQKYLTLHSELLIKLTLHIENNVFDNKAKLNQLISKYKTYFAQYIALLEQQGQFSTQGLAGENKRLSQVINERFLSFMVYVNQAAKQQSQQSMILTFVVILLCLFVAIFFSFFTNRRLGGGLFRINQFVENITRSDNFSMRLAMPGGDEVSDLAYKLDLLMAHIEELINRLNLAQARLVKEAKMASLGSMVKGFAHELNTPLGVAITSESHLRDQVEQLKTEFVQGKLQKGTLEKLITDAEGCLTLMETNLNRSADLIDSFKQVASHQEYDELVEFNVADFLNNLFDSLKHEIDKYDVNLNIDVTNGLIIKSYLGAFNQIFTILIINSLRHGIQNNEPLSIEIVGKIVGGSLHFRYIDDGKGVNESLLDKIFEPFVTTKRGKGGTGLGLSIVYNLVTQRLNGEIEFQSIEGNGVCIYLHFDHINYSLRFED